MEVFMFEDEKMMSFEELKKRFQNGGKVSSNALGNFLTLCPDLREKVIDYIVENLVNDFSVISDALISLRSKKVADYILAKHSERKMLLAFIIEVFPELREDAYKKYLTEDPVKNLTQEDFILYVGSCFYKSDEVWSIFCKRGIPRRFHLKLVNSVVTKYADFSALWIMKNDPEIKELVIILNSNFVSINLRQRAAEKIISRDDVREQHLINVIRNFPYKSELSKRAGEIYLEKDFDKDGLIVVFKEVFELREKIFDVIFPEKLNEELSILFIESFPFKREDVARERLKGNLSVKELKKIVVHSLLYDLKERAGKRIIQNYSSVEDVLLVIENVPSLKEEGVKILKEKSKDDGGMILLGLGINN
jgi:hypothetical protein